MIEVVPFIYETEDELLSNTYIVKDNKDCFVVDPSSNYDGIINYINKNKLHLKFILVTHAHFDHIGGLDRLYNAFKVKIYAGYEELDTFKDPHLNCSDNYGIKPLVVNLPIIPLGDNEIINGFSEKVKVIYTPYHTNGAVCYYLEDSKLLFSGDSLFNHCFGRSDLPTSIPSKMKESIAKMMALPDEVKVYPGHGKFTSIGNERRFVNMYNKLY